MGRRSGSGQFSEAQVEAAGLRLVLRVAWKSSRRQEGVGRCPVFLGESRIAGAFLMNLSFPQVLLAKSGLATEEAHDFLLQATAGLPKGWRTKMDQ